MITEQDIKMIAEKEGFFDILSFEPNKYTIPEDELDGKLEQYGMLRMYKKWDPYLREQGYRFAYPMNFVLSAGIHVQLTKRTGKTNAQLKKMAKEMVYGNTESNGW